MIEPFNNSPFSISNINAEIKSFLEETREEEIIHHYYDFKLTHIESTCEY